jgi:hypothetical protein
VYPPRPTHIAADVLCPGVQVAAGCVHVPVTSVKLIAVEATVAVEPTPVTA